ncbi:hypothetical protein GCM10010168_22380 [Actinoplanes ianthinogenes]|uniref:Uncharacterized protein n=1 Tax=Actinoplanes ianthinogenes TaxID=122358 RepID=A0ABN6CTC8_9ACTN|nr:hypothetical protein [Actinoplanes ianthinogenes]BCJ47879.1 hypothetical protein Aiant_85360 [Actinoplanes ianthinogenes]GGR04787.1 hypothetical protein GCM10010168_22380 [Actinoplanes ianthinogenes]
MEQDTSVPRSITDILVERGVPVTAEGKARAGRRLREADERRDTASRAALLARLRSGVPA